MSIYKEVPIWYYPTTLQIKPTNKTPINYSKYIKEILDNYFPTISISQNTIIVSGHGNTYEILFYKDNNIGLIEFVRFTGNSLTFSYFYQYIKYKLFNKFPEIKMTQYYNVK